VQRLAKKPFILADDLTGAMDTGVQLAGDGLVTGLLFRKRASPALCAAFDVLVLDTESRNILPDQAADTVRSQVEWAMQTGNRLVYKKIDSTMRGNIGAEIEAALIASGKTCALVAPAMPDNGRTTRAGMHFVYGVPLLETEFAKDPFAPVISSYIPEILAVGTKLPVSLLPIAVTRQGAAAVRLRLQELIKQGARIIVADAEVMDDLAVLSAATGTLNNLLPCGAADLLRLLLRSWTSLPDWPERSSQTSSGCTNTADQQDLLSENRPVIVLSGSPAQVSKMQIAAISARTDVTVIKIDPLLLIDSACSKRHIIQQVVSSSRQALTAGRHVVIDAAGSSKNAVFCAADGDLKQLMEHGRLISQALGEIASDLISLNRQMVGGLVIFGGDTACSILDRLGAETIRICGEVEPYIPAGRLIGGLCDGLRIVTKAGGFGNEATLDHILTLEQ
jgi:uncharacterized protein YgbK (DUF1537 family)